MKETQYYYSVDTEGTKDCLVTLQLLMGELWCWENFILYQINVVWTDP